MTAISELANAYLHPGEINEEYLKTGLQTAIELLPASVVVPPIMLFRLEHVEKKLNNAKEILNNLASVQPEIASQKCLFLNRLIPNTCEQITVGKVKIAKCEFNPSNDLLIDFKCFLWGLLDTLGTEIPYDPVRNTLVEAFDIRKFDLTINYILFSSSVQNLLKKSVPHQNEL